MFGLGMGELIVIGVVGVVVFGSKKFPELGASVAKGIKNFQKGMNEPVAPIEDNEKEALESKHSSEESKKDSK